jgi:geranylgeranyl diphosphate synthase type I
VTAANAAPKSLARARELVTPVLAAASATLSPELRHIVEYHWGWVDAAGQPQRGAAGKMLRPTLAMLSAEAVGAPAERASAAAAAVEIIHDFTLLHDDVMDGDRERRHRPTAWTVFGVGPAICGGDALVLLAQRLLLEDAGDARAAAALALNEAAAEVIAGQVLDLSFEGRFDVSLERYLEMAGQKTGALLACAASIGALAAGGPEAAVRDLHAYGAALGLAFQAVDDWLGIWGRPERTGKPVASDLRQRKSSLPIVFALNESDDAARALRALLEDPAALGDETSLAEGVALLDACGAEQRTRDEAARQIAAARRALARAPIAAAARDELSELTRFVVEREF